MNDRTRRRHPIESPQDDTPNGPGVAIIGVGAVGSSLARSLHKTKYRVLALVNRTLSTAIQVATEVGAPIASTSIGDVPDDARLIFICSREEEIPSIVNQLCEGGFDLVDAVIAHVSGRETAAILAALSERGAHTLSFHPLGSFPPGASDKTFSGMIIGLEGDDLGVAVGRAVAEDLGAKPVDVPQESKAAYHLAAAMTSNFLVTLVGSVQRLLEKAGLPVDLTLSLAEDTIANLRGSDPERALTGPIVRADYEALTEQVETLRRVAPEVLPLFLALAHETVNLALRSGRIDTEEGETLREILETSLPDGT